MQFVAASKLKRAQDATLAARPYSEKLDEVLADLADRARRRGPPAPRPARGRQAADRPDHDGPRPLPAPLNTNTIRFVAREITEHPGDLAVVTVGRKGRDAMRRARRPDRGPLRGLRRPADVRRRPAARPARSPTTTWPATYGRVDIVYSQFVSTLTQQPDASTELLPITAGRGHRGHPRQPVHLRAERRRPSSSSSCRATSRPACSRRSSRPRRARNRAGWSR